MLLTMTLVAPWRLMSSRASCMLPSPKPISVMTEAVPMMMPSTDRNERSLCSQRLRTAKMKLRRDLSQKIRNLLRDRVMEVIHKGYWIDSDSREFKFETNEAVTL